MTDVIAVENVTFAYDDRPVLRDISLSISEGEFFGLIGPNGSGKTTLLRIMLGLQSPDSGTVELFGRPARQFNEGTKLGYVSQQSSEAASRMPVTVRELVNMGRYAHAGLSRLSEEDHRVVTNVLERVGIADLADRRVNKLSGGQKQRAYIARALAAEAELLALDEPTVGVDADSVEQFYDLLDELNAEGITIALIEHDLATVTEHADSIACIDCELYEHCETREFLRTDALERAFSTHALNRGDHSVRSD